MVDRQTLDALESPDVRQALGAVGALRQRVDSLEPELVARARAEGVSWQEISRLLGKATSSVFERYRDA